MARVLVVEDTPAVASVLRRMLERAGFTVDVAEQGQVALDFVRTRPPDAIITDLRMPVMGGLELIEAVGRLIPGLPVIVTTGVGSDETAVEALQRGAASYVPKSKLDSQMLPTLKSVLAVSTQQKQKQLLLEHLDSSESAFHLNTDIGLVTPLVSHVDEMLERMQFCDEASRIRLGIALHEALVNAMVHGNLEISSECRDVPGAEYARLMAERMASEPFRSRKVFVLARICQAEARFVIRDEGPGFDPSRLPDPTESCNLHRLSGRGLFLIRTFLDDVIHNSQGNEITLIKRRLSMNGHENGNVEPDIRPDAAPRSAPLNEAC